MIRLFQGGADGADAAIHHVRGRNDVCAGFRMRQGLPGQHRDRFVVHHVSGIVNDAILAVRGVGVQGDVGNYDNVGIGFLDGPDRALNESVGIGALGAIETLPVGVDDREQGDSGYAQVDRLAERIEQPIDGLTLDAGHRLDLFSTIVTIEHENGVN